MASPSQHPRCKTQSLRFLFSKAFSSTAISLLQSARRTLDGTASPRPHGRLGDRLQEPRHLPGSGPIRGTLHIVDHEDLNLEGLPVLFENP